MDDFQVLEQVFVDRLVLGLQKVLKPLEFSLLQLIIGEEKSWGEVAQQLNCIYSLELTEGAWRSRYHRLMERLPKRVEDILAAGTGDHPEPDLSTSFMDRPFSRMVQKPAQS